MSGHGTLVPFPNGWRVFWRGQDWGTISRASARDDIRLRRTIFRPGGLNDIREPGLANGEGHVNSFFCRREEEEG